jgi:DNA-binding PadR family transcriptional regulator
MSLRAAILGFLSLEPTSGYTLRQRFEGSVSSFWSVTQSQIYRELHALEREGLVRPRREAGNGKPDRKVYALSEAGRGALDTWLREPLEPPQLRHPFLLKFVFSAELEPATLKGLLAGYRDSLVQTREEYAGRLAAVEIFSLARSAREKVIWKLSIEHGLAWCDAELAWLDRAQSSLSKVRTRAPRPKKT